MKTKFFITISVLLVLVLTTTVTAAGVGISPSIIDMKDLSRGNTYEKYIKILNLDDSDATVAISVADLGVNWVLIKDIETNEEITTLLVPANSEARFLAEFVIPSDAPNGKYKGLFDVRPLVDETSDSPVSFVAQGIFQFEITGEERITAEVESITTKETESGQPLRVSYDFRNTGNVGVTPSARLTIKQDGKQIDTAETEGVYTKSGEYIIQEATWDTENRGTGDFEVLAQVYLNGEKIAQKELPFKIVPRGTYTAETLVGDIEKPETLVVNEIGKTKVKLFNVGKIDVTAKIVAEVVDKTGKVVDVVTSEEILIKPGNSENVEYYLKPTKEGDFTVRSKAFFSGKEQAMGDYSFSVVSEEGAASSSSEFNGSSNILTIILIALVAFLLVGLVIFGVTYFRKRY